MADKEVQPEFKQAVVIQFAALCIFGLLAYFDVQPDGQLNISIYLYLALLSIGVGLSPDAWSKLLQAIIDRISGGKK